MPPLSDKRRKALEADMAKEVGKLNERSRRAVLRELGDPPRIENISDSFWDLVLSDFQTTLNPPLEKVFIEAAQALVSEVGLSVDFDLINEGAVNWARGYTNTVSTQMLSYRQSVVGDAVADFYEDRIDMRGVIGRISRVFSPSKAEEIAVTEITRAAVEGERPIVEALGNQGVMVRGVWVTVRDKHVCPICEPMDGLRASGLGFDAPFIHPQTGRQYRNPPAHTRCRCGVRYEYENEMINAN